MTDIERDARAFIIRKKQARQHYTFSFGTDQHGRTEPVAYLWPDSHLPQPYSTFSIWQEIAAFTGRNREWVNAVLNEVIHLSPTPR